jgi:hypothetical protein
MPLSAAERAKRYRDKIKSDPARHEQYIQSEKDRYKARRERGDFDLTQKTERERRQIRRTMARDRERTQTNPKDMARDRERTQTNPKDMARDKKKSEKE